MRELSVIVPAYNEVDTISEVIDVFSCFKLIIYKRFDIFNQCFLLKSF